MSGTRDDERRILEMSIFASYFDLFAVEAPALQEALPLEAPAAQGRELAAGAELAAAPALDAALAVFEQPPEIPAAFSDPSTSYRNDTTDVGYVMDPSASNWQDMVWVDPD
jgi:hypothetical protein